MFSKFISLVEDIHSNNKKLPIKINKWLKHQLSVQNGQLIDFRNSISNKIPFFCGSAYIPKFQIAEKIKIKSQ